MELSPTSRVILGMLGRSPMSGYDIKSFVDRSTRYFWAASYGQIYPELRRLADAGLIEGADQGQGERPRTVYELTPTGRAALREWLAGPTKIQEARDESLLRVFFSDFAGAEATVAALEAKRDHHAEVAARLRELRPEQPDPADSALLTLRFGIALNEFVAGWCEHEAGAQRALARGEAA